MDLSDIEKMDLPDIDLGSLVRGVFPQRVIISYEDAIPYDATPLLEALLSLYDNFLRNTPAYQRDLKAKDLTRKMTIVIGTVFGIDSVPKVARSMRQLLRQRTMAESVFQN